MRKDLKKHSEKSKRKDKKTGRNRAGRDGLEFPGPCCSLQFVQCSNASYSTPHHTLSSIPPNTDKINTTRETKKSMERKKKTRDTVTVTQKASTQRTAERKKKKKSICTAEQG